MVLRKENYRDMDKFNETRYEQRKRYYQKSQKYEPKIWSDAEIEEILNPEIPDSELSKILCRSVGAIQGKRCNIKKALRL